MRYRKKPIDVDAFQLGVDYFPEWFTDAVHRNVVTLYNSYSVNADIITLEGIMHASNKDFIIRGIDGELYPCKPDIFNKTYERTSE